MSIDCEASKVMVSPEIAWPSKVLVKDANNVSSFGSKKKSYENVWNRKSCPSVENSELRQKKSKIKDIFFLYGSI